MRLQFPQTDLLLITGNRVFPQVYKYWTPGKNFPSAVFLATSSLTTSVNTGSGEGHLRHWQPLKKQATTSFPWQCACPAGEEAQSCGAYWSLSEASFFDSLHFHLLCLWAMETSHAPSLHVTPWEGHACWGVLQAPLPFRRACSTVPIWARAYPCPGPLPK